MPTADTVTIVVTLAGALGVGTVLRSLLDHSLTRPDREARLSERLVNMSDIQIKRLDAALADMREENTTLRARIADLEQKLKDDRGIARPDAA